MKRVHPKMFSPSVFRPISELPASTAVVEIADSRVGRLGVFTKKQQTNSPNPSIEQKKLISPFVARKKNCFSASNTEPHYFYRYIRKERTDKFSFHTRMRLQGLRDKEANNAKSCRHATSSIEIYKPSMARQSCEDVFSFFFCFCFNARQKRSASILSVAWYIVK